MSRAFGSSLGIMAACLMAGLLGAIAISGRWPVDAPRTHVEAGGILSLAPERVSRVEFSSGEQRAIFSRNFPEEWLFNDAPTEPAIAGHIDTAIRLLTISPPRRVLAASEYSPDQLTEYDPPASTTGPGITIRSRLKPTCLVFVRSRHLSRQQASRPFRKHLVILLQVGARSASIS